MTGDRATEDEQDLAKRLGAEAAALLASLREGALLLAPGGLLWANAAAAASLGLPLDTLMQRGLPASAPGTQRLMARLADAPSPQPGLERLRFFVGFRGVMRLAGCRRLTLADGEAGLIVVFLEAEPKPTEPETWPAILRVAEPERRPAPVEAQPAPVEATGSDQPDPAPHPVAVALPGPVAPAPAWLAAPEAERRSRRFLFALDAAGRVLNVTPPLAETVGAAAAAIEGQLLPDALRPHDDAAAGLVAEALAAGETFSGIRVVWPVDGGRAFVPIDLSALPLVSVQDGLTGFSGFGLCRIDQARIDEAPIDQAPIDEASIDQTMVEAAPANESPPAEADAVSPVDPVEDAEAEPPVAVESMATDMPAPAMTDEPVTTDLHEPAAPSPDRVETAEEQRDDEKPAADTPSGDGVTLETVAADLEAFVRDQVRDAMPAPTPAKPAEPSDDAQKIVSLRTGQPTQPLPGFKRQGLSMSERNAFREIAKALGARFDEDMPDTPAPPSANLPASPDRTEPESLPAGEPAPAPTPQAGNGAPADLLDRLPIGLLVLRGDEALFANRTLLDLTGYADLAQFRDEQGARAIFRKGVRPRDSGGAIDTVVLTSRDGEMMPVDAHLQLIEWEGAPATLISMRRAVELEQGKALRGVAQDLKRARADIAELRAILDTATDGVAILDEKGTILGLNGAAQALFGIDENEMVGESFTQFLHRDSQAEALDYLEGMRSASGMRSIFNDGREISGREKKGGRIPLFMTLGRISDEDPQRFCAVLRDMTAWKRAEAGLTEARQAAEMANAKKSDFLAKISHEIRTPMNAIIGFAELMQDERLGPLGNAKYKEYLGDIRTSGQHVVSLVNDLLDLAKIEAGRMELNFAATDLNAIVGSTVAIIQPQATQSRVLVRTQLAQTLPPVVADERSIRQIVLNMLSNATRFTEAGGQVIVSTSLLSTGEVTIRIRDTGIGMTANEIEQALEPFRQVGRDRAKGGTGLGLPLTRALVEANRAQFGITSKPGEGTMVEITFPPTRVLAE
ncbi:MAG: PAS domain-containing sensor histidine kinase [Methylobacterium sp.]|nr:MAG: PAS domain-containing sensor histidine kinase [Methylobacterium sp.]